MSSTAGSRAVAVAIDAGTTGVRALAINLAAEVVAVTYREFPQYFPTPGWVEHDAEEIFSAVATTLRELMEELRVGGYEARAIGITNQRETTVAWDRQSGAALRRAIVWQDRRTAGLCRQLEADGHLAKVRARTGLVLDPYFSATKMHWLLHEGGVAVNPSLALGTVDSWLLWRLTGSVDGGVFATDVTNASRTLLYDIHAGRWSTTLADLFGVPTSALPEVFPSSHVFGHVAAGLHDDLTGLPVAGIAGDQHAALFGQACFTPGQAKVTIGTGSFALLNAGVVAPEVIPGLLTTLACPGPGGETVYATEGSVFVSGAGVQWLRDGRGLFSSSAELEQLARSVDSSEGVTFVPALTGLGSPHWDPEARGIIMGLSRGSGRAAIARAMIDAMAFQVTDVMAAMAASPVAPTEIRVDGGAAANDLLLQLIADFTQLPVSRPRAVETTALGAATLAGLATGLWSSPADLAHLWHLEATFTPAMGADEAESRREIWRRAVDRSRRWATD